MDALFGLPRKKSAGVSYREPIQGGIFFEEQSSLDEFVANAQSHKQKKRYPYLSVSVRTCMVGLC